MVVIGFKYIRIQAKYMERNGNMNDQEYIEELRLAVKTLITLLEREQEARDKAEQLCIKYQKRLLGIEENSNETE